MRKYKTEREKIFDKFYNKEISENELQFLLKKNEERLEKKRKYKVGEIINSVEELQSCDFVYCFGNRPICVSFLESMPFRQVMIMLKGNRIRKAILKEKINNGRN